MAYYQRTRSVFNPQSTEPFKLSRSKIEDFIRCPRCFYLDRRLGISQPSMPSFTINKTIDELFKKEFDVHRAAGHPHPLMTHYKIDAVPFDHDDLEKWRHNFTGIQYLDPSTNFLITGAVDDIWINRDGQLHVVDYKATSKEGVVGIEDEWKISYKRQLEIYQWLLRKNGFDVSPVGYFVYANGKKDADAFDGNLEFDIQVIPYEGNAVWVDQALKDAKLCLMNNAVPDYSLNCEYCRYLQQATAIKEKNESN